MTIDTLSSRALRGIGSGKKREGGFVLQEYSRIMPGSAENIFNQKPLDAIFLCVPAVIDCWIWNRAYFFMSDYMWQRQISRPSLTSIKSLVSF